MTIRDFANLPENFDYFWIEKQSRYSFYPYLGYYRGCQSIAMTISDLKKSLLKLYAAKQVREYNNQAKINRSKDNITL